MKLPKALTREQLAAVIDNLPNSLNELIRGFMPRAVQIANVYSQRNEAGQVIDCAYNADLVGAAMLSLVSNAKRMIEVRDNWEGSQFIPYNWLSAQIKNAVRVLRHTNHLRVYSRYKYYEAKKQGKTLPKVYCVEDLDKRGKSPVNRLMIREAIANATRTPFETRIVRMLGQGYNFQEIAETEGVTSEWVRQSVNKIRGRLLEFNITVSRRGRRDKTINQRMLSMVG